MQPDDGCLDHLLNALLLPTTAQHSTNLLLPAILITGAVTAHTLIGCGCCAASRALSASLAEAGAVAWECARNMLLETCCLTAVAPAAASPALSEHSGCTPVDTHSQPGRT